MLWQRIALGLIAVVFSLFASSANFSLAQSFEQHRSQAMNGDAESQYELALRYDTGDDVTADIDEAIVWYKMAASQGHTGAMHNLGLTFEIGDRVNVDIAAAVKWYRSAADRAYGPSQYNLAEIYSEENSAWSDYEEALRLYQLAIESGEPDAAAGIGQMYANGLGVSMNTATAARKYRESAIIGGTTGQALLGLSLLYGEGVAQDRVRGFAWMFLAEAAFSEESDIQEFQSFYRPLNPTTAEETAARELAASFVAGIGIASIASPEIQHHSGSSELVESTQQALSALGYYNGEIDGLMGPRIRQAIKTFERDWEIPETGNVSGELSIYIGAAVAMELANTGELEQRSDSSGSGFYVSEMGHIVTNYHVVTACETITSGTGEVLKVLATEEASDLALLRTTKIEESRPLGLRIGRGIRLADELLVAGFPLGGIITPDLNVTIGNVTALSGPELDRSLIQISAPVQPGNSGGPVLDFSGRVVGVVVSKLDALAVAAETGDIPQNVNFAISLGTLQSFLDSHGIEYLTSSITAHLDPAEIAELARQSTVKVQCH